MIDEMLLPQTDDLISQAMLTAKSSTAKTMVEDLHVDELRALTAFCRSKQGASVMTKMQPFVQRRMTMVMPVTQEKSHTLTPHIITIS